MLIAAISAFSCQKEDFAGTGTKELRFSASINAALDYEVKSTKAEGSKFAEGTHNLGIWICNPDSSPVIREFENCKAEYSISNTEGENWIFTGNGRTWENTISLDDSRAVTIYSYYPWNENVTDLTKIPVTAIESDFMWCEPIQLSEDDTKGDGVLDVALNYKRIMTCIEVVVKSHLNDAIRLDEITLTDISDANFATTGTFDATTGVLSLGSEDRLEKITLTSAQMLTNDDNTPKHSFIFHQYENYNGNFELSFKFNGIDGLTTYSIPNEITGSETGPVKFEAGKKYIVTLQLNEAMKFSVVDFKTVDDWNTTDVETDIEM